MFLIRLTYMNDEGMHREVNFACASYEKYTDDEGRLSLLFYDDANNLLRNVPVDKHGYVDAYIMNPDGKTIDKHSA